MRIILIEEDGSVYRSFDSQYGEPKATLRTLNMGIMENWLLDPQASMHYTNLMGSRYSAYRRN